VAVTREADAIGVQPSGEEARPAGARGALALRRPFTRLEFLLALLGLSLVTAAALWPHIRHGGFYMDDWANAAGSLQPPGGHHLGEALSYFASLTIYRPVLVLYVPLTFFAFGTHAAYHLAWAAALAMLAATMFYAVLRTVGVPWVHALVIAALTIVFPWSDSTRLWATADQETLSILFMMTGLFVALVGLRRREWKWHAAAAILYLLSILTYEVTIPLIACAGLLYCVLVGWRRARARWLIDIAVAGAGAIWVAVHTNRSPSGLSGDIDHLKIIVTNGGTILGRAGLPIGSQRTTLVLCVLMLTLGVGVAAYLFRGRRFTERGSWGLREWLFLLVGGLALAALGWMMFIPADPYYTPSVYGMTNRVNGLAAFGLVTAVYSAFGVVSSLAAGALPGRRALVGATVALLLGLALLASYTHVLRRHISIWDTAYRAENTAIERLEADRPRLPHDTTIFAGSYPAYQTLGVPILGATWDLDGMVKLGYEDMSLHTVPILPERHLICRQGWVALVGPGVPQVTAPYRSALLIDLQTGREAHPHSRASCRQVVDGFVPGPLYLSSAY